MRKHLTLPAGGVMSMPLRPPADFFPVLFLLQAVMPMRRGLVRFPSRRRIVAGYLHPGRST
ncbi:MAG: hypothetical protein JNJ90_04035 [Saprospiraceae bacterium]|nr:hypothetical protein [Saprospiraceae bacterium]